MKTLLTITIIILLSGCASIAKKYPVAHYHDQLIIEQKKKDYADYLEAQQRADTTKYVIAKDNCKIRR